MMMLRRWRGLIDQVDLWRLGEGVVIAIVQIWSVV